MCGICGQINLDAGQPVDRHIIDAMVQALHARGPDDRGVYLKGAVGLGSTRLSILDVVGGRMPIANETGDVWIVYNGEVYNSPELRKRLEGLGHRFATNTDTEAIVHLYEQVGDDFAKQLNGMFATAIWDERRRCLILARDHLGIKPLYYGLLDDKFVFGSELKAILAAGIDRRVDPAALHDYLSLNYVPGPRSMFAGIQKLPPGHLLTFEPDTQTISVQQFWDVPLASCESRPSTRELEADLLALLRQVVKDQMISDVPLGAFLSGGIDSSLIVALMSEVSAKPVQTFSVGFHEKSYDESPYARIVAERFQTNHHELILEPKAEVMIEQMADYFDEPFADSSALAVHAISEFASDRVKVVLSGDGGDEVFGGYATYQADKLAGIYRCLPGVLGNRVLPRLAQLIPASDKKVSFDFKLKRFVNGAGLPPLPAHVAWKAFFSEEIKQSLYSPEFAENQPLPTVRLMQEHYDAYDTGDTLNRLLYVDSKIQLVDDMLTKVDRMSMSQSIEVRVPLLDVRLVEFMARLPSQLKVRRLTLKYLLKRVAARLLPEQILRRRKAGFHVPIAKWVKGDLKTMIGDYLSPAMIARAGFFDAEVVTRMLNDHWRGRSDYSRNIWSLLMFSLWCERYLHANILETAESAT